MPQRTQPNTMEAMSRKYLMKAAENGENWMGLLDILASCPGFESADQALIYGQRPDAKAVARYEDWGSKYHRTVKRDARAIYLFNHDPSSTKKLTVVFDIADTREGFYNRATRESFAPAVEMPGQHSFPEGIRAQAGERLRMEYALPATGSESLEETIQDAAGIEAAESFEDTVNSLIEAGDGDFMEIIANGAMIQEFLVKSASYVACRRLGIEGDVFTGDDFSFIGTMRDAGSILALAGSVNDISTPVAELLIRHAAELSASITNVGAPKRDSESLEDKGEETNDDGRTESEVQPGAVLGEPGYRDPVPPQGGTLDAEHSRGNEETGHGEVGPDVDPVHEGEPQRAVQPAPDAGRPVRPGSEGTGGGGRADPDRNGSDPQNQALQGIPDVPGQIEERGDGADAGRRGDRTEPGTSGEVTPYSPPQSGQAGFIWDMEEEPEALPGYEELVKAYPADPQIPSESEQEEEVMSQEEGETAQEKELPLEEGFSAAVESRDLRLGKGQRFTFRGETYEIRDLAGPHADGSGDAAHGAQYLIAVNISETPKATSPYALEYYGDWASYLMEDAGFLVHDGMGEGPFSYGFTSPLDYGKPNVSAGDIVLFGENRYTVRSADSQSARIELKEITDGRDEGRELSFTMRIPEPYAVLYRRSWPDLMLTRRMEQRQNARQHPETRREAPAIRTNHAVSKESYEESDASTRMERNLEALRILKRIRKEERRAVRREQAVLGGYTGFGGLKVQIENNRTELESLVTQSQLESILDESEKGRSLPAYAIEAIYEKLHEFGFKRGNLISYHMSDSGFEALKPRNMRSVTFSAIEDSEIPRWIFSQLYQKDSITSSNRFVEGNTYDASIALTPYGNNGRLPEDPFYINREGLGRDDYTVAKQLDLVRPGGIAVCVCSTNLLDRSEEAGRKYLASRAVLLGAVRLPETMFIHAGTQTEPCDILFFKKKAVPSPESPEWLYVQEDAETDGVYYNRYFGNHPENVIGVASIESGRPSLTYSGAQRYELMGGMDPSDALKDAMKHVSGTYTHAATITQDDDLFSGSTFIPADPSVRNFTFTAIGDDIYFRENARMRKIEAGRKKAGRIRGMVRIRDITLDLISAETNGAEDDVINGLMEKLNAAYDSFVEENEILNANQNRLVFRDDATYALLCSLENVDEDGNFLGKADIFTQRTIRPAVRPEHVDTAVDALAISMREKGRIDLAYMEQLTGMDRGDMIEELGVSAFEDPQTQRLIPNDEYLSGNVRQKLAIAENAAQRDERYKKNVEALKKVQPEWIRSENIEVHIGATWIPEDYYTLFMYETFRTPDTNRRDRRNYWPIEVQFSQDSGKWIVTNTSSVYRSDTTAYSRFGTRRMNAYEIFESSLNLRQVQVKDREEYINDQGERASRYVVNVPETEAARDKQNAIEDEFRKWIFADPDRTADLEQAYNLRFNNLRSRHFDGSFLAFPGMNPSVDLMEHQKNGAARIVFSKHNSLLGQVVGAGKTYEMIAGCMERKRLGLSRKALFVVPNHLTAQWGADFYRLYPGAKILVATKRDFQKHNRFDFMSRIATGDYDAVIVGQSKFDRFMPLSKEYMKDLCRDRIAHLNGRLQELEQAGGSSYYKQREIEHEIERAAKTIRELEAAPSDDKVITFDQLGIDALYVDEAHGYKNLSFETKMGHLSGISSQRSAKTEEMFMKCRYIEQESGGTGVVFATGTPLTNSFTELYTMMRYLELDELESMGLGGFDSWASTFGMKEDLFEVNPTGTGFRTISKFSKFYNLPELITLFSEIADIKTREDISLPVPRAVYTNIETEKSPEQEDLISEIEERADNIHNHCVDPHEDNMLKITTDGRKLALDQRLINPALPEAEDSKAKAVVEKCMEIYERTQADRGTQVIFCDQAVPKQGREFSIYDDVRDKLIVRGVPESEIAFVQDYKTEVQKAALFGKVRAGQVRILIGSTAMMGTGTNIQTRLAALHHLDVPWRPSDIEQREGRIIRQGNRFPQVHIFRYITSGTFDAYNWQILENKQRFIAQIMNSKGFARSCDEVDQSVNTYAEVKAICSGNEDIRQQILLSTRLNRLSSQRSAFMKQQDDLRERERNELPRELALISQKLELCREDYEYLHERQIPASGTFRCEIDGMAYTDRAEAGNRIAEKLRGITACETEVKIGSYMGFELGVRCSHAHQYRKEVVLRHKTAHSCEVAAYAKGEKIMDSADEALGGIGERVFLLESKKRNLEQSIEDARFQLAMTFPNEEEFQKVREELEEVMEKIREGSEASQEKRKKKKHKTGEEAPAQPDAEQTGQSAEIEDAAITAEEYMEEAYRVNEELEVRKGDFAIIDATRYRIDEISDDALSFSLAAKEGDCDFREDAISTLCYGTNWKENANLIRGMRVGAAFRPNDTPEHVRVKYRSAALTGTAGIPLPFIPPAEGRRRHSFRIA